MISVNQKLSLGVVTLLLLAACDHSNKAGFSDNKRSGSTQPSDMEINVSDAQNSGVTAGALKDANAAKKSEESEDVEVSISGDAGSSSGSAPTAEPGGSVDDEKASDGKPADPGTQGVENKPEYGSDDEDTSGKSADANKEGQDTAAAAKAKEGAEPGSEEGENENKPSDEELSDCSGKMKGKTMVTGNKSKMEIEKSDTLVLKVAGNQADVKVKLKSDTNATLEGLCLFVTGNQAHVSIVIETGVKGFYVKMRGNKAKVDISVAEGDELSELNRDLNGNDPSLVISGAGKYDCTGGTADDVAKTCTFKK